MRKDHKMILWIIFPNEQIFGILKQAENGAPFVELCREHCMSNASFYAWRSKSSEMDATMITELRESKAENAPKADVRWFGDAE